MTNNQEKKAINRNRHKNDTVGGISKDCNTAVINMLKDLEICGIVSE